MSQKMNNATFDDGYLFGERINLDKMKEYVLK